MAHRRHSISKAIESRTQPLFSQVNSQKSESNTNISYKGRARHHPDNVVEIDMAKVEEMLKELRDHSDTQISDLNGELKDKYDTIVSYVAALYDTEVYNCFFELIQQVFVGVLAVPGTLGAYFTGCLTATNEIGGSMGCSVTCANSVPFPKDNEEFKFCDYAVVVAKYDSNTNQYILAQLRHREHEEGKSIVFLLDTPNNYSFHGFNASEKQWLKNNNYRLVQLVSYSAAENKYVPLQDDFIPIDGVRNRIERNSVRSSGIGSVNYFRANIMVIIVIILVLLIIYWMGKKNGRRSRTGRYHTAWKPVYH